MKQLSSQRQPQPKRRAPWKGKLLLMAPPFGCGAAGAAICAGGKSEMSMASVGKAGSAPDSGAGALNGAAAGLVIGMIAAHAIRWFQRR